MEKLNGSQAIIVLGMHRSGTSALTGFLEKIGVYLGTDLLEPADDNPKGFWEDKKLVDLHDRILSTLGLHYNDMNPLPQSWLDTKEVQKYKAELKEILAHQFLGHQLWGVKDPRLCRLVPLWRQVLSELQVNITWVITVRNPLEVVASLKNREGFTEPKSLLLWLRYNLEAEASTRGLSRVVTSFEELLADWTTVHRKLDTALGGNCLDEISDEIKGGVEQHLDAKLRHESIAFPEHIRGKIGTLVAEAYTSLQALVDCDGKPTAVAAIDEVAQELAEIDEISAIFCAEKVNPILSALVGAQHAACEAQQQVIELKQSTSWRVTAPLRKARKLLP